MGVQNIVILDPIGLKSGGVTIRNVHLTSSAEEDRLTLYGNLTCDSSALAGGLEPQVICDILNQSGDVCFTTEGHYAGRFWSTRKVSFTITIVDVSRLIPDIWSAKSTYEIKLYLVFC